MREIKFRMWDKELQSFDMNKDINIYTDFPEGIKHITYFVGAVAMSGVCIEQFTGLKDKNGKEIYEGDIIDFWLSNGYGVVEFKNCQWVSTMKDKDDTILTNFSDIEVIGNIHENKELLQ